MFSSALQSSGFVQIRSSNRPFSPLDSMDLEAGVEETGCLLSSSGSKNLLLCFSGSFALDKTEEPIGSDSDEIELGLSLGGSLNSVNSHNSRILRSSSIPAILPSEGPPLFLLPRTCSLPEEEIKSNKRKRDECMGAALASQASVVSQGSSSFRGSDLQSPPGRGLELPGFTHASEIRNPSRFLTVLEHKSPSPLSSKTPISIPNNGVAIINESVRNETVLIKNNNGGKCRNWSGELSKMIEEMPSVSAKGRGPNGRRIDGFLCKYGKGEEVSIVCVCHGSFLTPAEFVKHAGGGDVEHPLRHIVVNPSNAGASSAFL